MNNFKVKLKKLDQSGRKATLKQIQLIKNIKSKLKNYKSNKTKFL